MHYEELIRGKPCPFCSREEMNLRVVRRGWFAALVLNRAPYIKHHLMVIPNRHILRYEELRAWELWSVHRLMKLAALLVRKAGDEDYSLLLRVGENNGKSIDHMHFHIIPRAEVTAIGPGVDESDDRPVLSPLALRNTLNKFRSLMKKL